MRADIPNDKSSRGLSGSIRVLAMTLILVLAGLGVGVVLDVISLDSFGAITKRAAVVTCIVALACVGIGLLSTKRPRL